MSAPQEDGLRERLRSTAEATIFAACDGWCDRPSQIAYEAAGQVADALLPVVESYVEQRVDEALLAYEVTSRAENARLVGVIEEWIRKHGLRGDALRDAEARLDEWRQRAIAAERAQGIAEADRADTLAGHDCTESEFYLDLHRRAGILDRKLAETTAENDHLRAEVNIQRDAREAGQRALADAEARLAAAWDDGYAAAQAGYGENRNPHRAALDGTDMQQGASIAADDMQPGASTGQQDTP